MKGVLVIGLGNPLMGDDGVGCAVAERLARDPRLPDDTEVLCGGTDLLRYQERMEGRNRVILLDAFEDDAEPGSVVRFDDVAAVLDDRQEHVHQLSAVQAMGLLQTMTPVRFTLLGIRIPAVRVGAALSRAVAERMPGIVEEVLREVSAG
jgi:hydrogenase maturation protease